MGAGKSRQEAYKLIVDAITEAENGTSGEIHVHVSRGFVELDPFKHAVRLFNKFRLYNTEKRNAVLLYVNMRRRKFAVIGDEGIHKAVGQGFWDKLATDLTRDLRQGPRQGNRLTDDGAAIASAVKKIGRALQELFPAAADSENVNELPDQVTED